MKPVQPSKKSVIDKKAPISTPLESQGEAKPNEKSKYFSYLINLWIFIPAIIYFNLVNKYAVNFPYQDDYNAILEFLTQFKTASFVDKIALLFSQHADHRILHSRLIYVTYHAIFGKINFIHIIFIANLQLLVIFMVLVHFIKKAIPKYWNVVSLIVGFCLFDPSSYENADFAMCGIQNYGIIMLFIVSLYLYTKSGNKYLVLAGLVEAICIFSSGNGLICALLITLYLILSKEKTKYITSGIIFVVCSALYYFHYTKAQNLGEVHEAFSVIRAGRFFFHMLGGHFSFDYGIPIGISALVLMVVLLPINLKLKFKENTLPLVCVLAVLMATTTTIALFRNNQDIGEIAAYSSRYLIYSHSIMAVLFVFLWLKLDGTKFVWPAAAVGAILLIYAYKGNYTYGEGCMEMVKRRLENIPYYYSNHKEEANAKAKAIEQAACKEGIYCIQDER